DETGSFLLMHNRAWQFHIGSIAFEVDAELDTNLDVSKKSRTISSKKEQVTSSRLIISLFIVLTFICFAPLQVPIRVSVTIFTGLLLLFGSKNQIGLLSNQAMVKLGNGSYVLYLVHWPVITLYKYYNDV
ncbi:hypothetical protein PRIPAC_76128, partial [Pristionchus pacificus]